ncbi:DUF2637 domain-containing protein, partial [Nocardiopsis synnemataformans]|uniref:DUF2637 domain-containing protein n=1 Tax=Nocardiopsis synnemataformans TaxID=61305 RepID=UPI003EB6BCD2
WGNPAPLSASEGGALKARLLRLGSDDRDEEETEAFAPVARPGRDEDGGGEDPRPAGDPETSGRSEAFGVPEAFEERRARERDPEPGGVWDRDEPGRDEDGWDDEEFAAEPLPGADTDAPESDTEDDGDGVEASVPTLRLPRRSRDGHNPIKRAAEEAPVVPGAASPADVEPEPEAEPEAEPVAVVPDHLADEGFEHEPPFGDPVSDEADAPPVAAEPAAEPEPHVEPDPHVEPEPEPGTGAVTAFGPEPGPLEEPAEFRRESAPVVAPGPEPAAGSEDAVTGSVPEPTPMSAFRSTPSEPDPEPEPGPATEPEPVAAYVPVGAPTAEEPREAQPSTAAAESRTSGHGTGHGAPAATASDRADDPDTAHWEPPEDDSGAHALADYVPPVWTPPEDDASPFAEEPEPEPTPVLDHDTGPTVRAAFRISDVPPEAARPSDEPVEPAPGLEEARARHEADEDRFQEEDPLQEPEPLGGPEPSVPDADLPPEAEDLPPTVQEESGDGQAPSSPAHPAEPVPAPDAGRPAPERRGPLTPVEKRPMVLKPPRPPMPDFASGPPSRRVRSEPLRPDE